MSRPGKINVLPPMEIEPPAGINKASALIAFALLNTDVSFAVEGRNKQEIREYIALNTTANPQAVNQADFIFISGLHDPAIIAEAKFGNLSYPEESATFIINVSKISKATLTNTQAMLLKGPGIKTSETVFIAGISAELLDAVKEQNLEFPLGIDLMLTDPDNNLLCIPRSNQFELIGEAVNN